VNERSPPRLALWLLKTCASPYQRDALMGDLIEQYREGRNRAWCWKQVAAAILLARARAIRAAPWGRAGKVTAHLLAETAAVLAVVVIVDQARRAHSAAGMMSRAFVSTLAVLLAVALLGFLVSTRPRKPGRHHAAGNVLLLTFGLIALGVGTISWAGTLMRTDTVRGNSCELSARVCTQP
jgi:hypothetical protein